MAVDFQKVVRELIEGGLSQADIAREIRERVPDCRLSQPSVCRIANGKQSVSFSIGQALLDLHKSQSSEDRAA